MAPLTLHPPESSGGGSSGGAVHPLTPGLPAPPGQLRGGQRQQQQQQPSIVPAGRRGQGGLPGSGDVDLYRPAPQPPGSGARAPHLEATGEAVGGAEPGRCSKFSRWPRSVSLPGRRERRRRRPNFAFRGGQRNPRRGGEGSAGRRRSCRRGLWMALGVYVRLPVR